ncbi:hypothetical protein M0812_25728 [Anaeramoeba flamelloides]|uniref:Tetratricopeptide repeat protein n=1 Tax=Anaeramoeba flamelloides TaxID=1746091 RepID=A0AAV7YHM7_9EUKA|nr:hypothetical protein M0812_25728 [Anaeramoeba flamelloides]
MDWSKFEKPLYQLAWHDYQSFQSINLEEIELTKYSEHLNNLFYCKFPEILQNIEKLSINLESIPTNVQEILATFQDQLKKLLPSFDEEQLFDLFGIVVGCLLIFIQTNWVGPSQIEDKNVPICPFVPTLTKIPDELNQIFLKSIEFDGEIPYHNINNVSFLLFAQEIFKNASYFEKIPTFYLWNLRIQYIIQKIISGPSPKLKKEIENMIPKCLEKISNIYNKAKIYIEFSLISLYYYENEKAEEYLGKAKDITGLEGDLTGFLGKRTKFQQFETPQLVLKVESKLDKLITNEEKRLTLELFSEDVENQDETLLNEVKLNIKNKKEIESLKKPIHEIDQCIILATSEYILKTNPTNIITKERIKTHYIRILASPLNWICHNFSLLNRSILEKGSIKTIERSTNQVKELVHQFYNEEYATVFSKNHMKKQKEKTKLKEKEKQEEKKKQEKQEEKKEQEEEKKEKKEKKEEKKEQEEEKKEKKEQEQEKRKENEQDNETEKKKYAENYQRFPMFFCLNYPNFWEIQTSLAKLWLSIGVSSSAIVIFQRLESWGALTECYLFQKQYSLAEKLIKKLINKKKSDLSLLYCLMGDINKDITWYKKAWKHSNKTYARAQRSIAEYYYKKKKYQKSIKYFEKSLQINPLYPSIWFKLGYASTITKQYEKALSAYGRCVKQKPNDGESWNNLATIFLRLNRKSEAYFALTQSSKQNYNSWQIWENLFLLSLDVGEIQKTVYVGNRLFQMGKKELNIHVLRKLVLFVGIENEEFFQRYNSDQKKNILNQLKNKFFKNQLHQLLEKCSKRSPLNPDIWNVYAIFWERNNIINKSIQSRQKALKFLEKVKWYTEKDPYQEVFETAIELRKSMIKLSNVNYNEKEQNSISNSQLEKNQDLIDLKKLLNSIELQLKSTLKLANEFWKKDELYLELEKLFDQKINFDFNYIHKILLNEKKLLNKITNLSENKKIEMKEMENETEKKENEIVKEKKETEKEIEIEKKKEKETSKGKKETGIEKKETNDYQFGFVEAFETIQDMNFSDSDDEDEKEEKK